MCLLGDVPASNFMGGFKEGVGFALRKCQACLATQEDIQTKVILHIININVLKTNLLYYMYLVSHKINELVIRNNEDHSEHFKLIESDRSSNQGHSTTYGRQWQESVNEVTWV